MNSRWRSIFSNLDRVAVQIGDLDHLLARMLRFPLIMSEKRHFVRHPTSIPIEVRLLGGRRDVVEIDNISLGGLAFAFHWPIAVGVSIEVGFPRLADHLSLKGCVVRCEGRGIEWMIGIAFEQTEEVFRMRMLQQICHIEDYRKRMKEAGRELNSNQAAAEWIEAYASQFPHCKL